MGTLKGKFMSPSLAFVEEAENGFDRHYLYSFHITLIGSDKPIPFECVAVTDIQAWLIVAEKANHFNFPVKGITIEEKK